MYCNIKLINLNNKKSINIESNINNNGIVCTNFSDNQVKGDFQRTKGVNQLGQSINSSTLSVRDLVLEGIKY